MAQGSGAPVAGGRALAARYARLERAMLAYLIGRMEAEGASKAVTAADIQLGLALLARTREATVGPATRFASAADTDATIRRKLDALAAEA